MLTVIFKNLFDVERQFFGLTRSQLVEFVKIGAEF
jgi:hypothetical protein